MIMLIMMAIITARTSRSTRVTSIFLISALKQTNALSGNKTKSNVVIEKVE